MNFALGDLAIFARMPDIPDDLADTSVKVQSLRSLLGKVVRLVAPLGTEICGYTGHAMCAVEVEERENGMRTQFWASADMLDKITRH